MDRGVWQATQLSNYAKHSIHIQGTGEREKAQKKLDRWEGNQKTKLRTNRKKEDFKKWEEEMESTE